MRVCSKLCCIVLLLVVVFVNGSAAEEKLRIVDVLSFVPQCYVVAELDTMLGAVENEDELSTLYVNYSNASRIFLREEAKDNTIAILFNKATTQHRKQAFDTILESGYAGKIYKRVYKSKPSKDMCSRLSKRIDFNEM